MVAPVRDVPANETVRPRPALRGPAELILASRSALRFKADPVRPDGTPVGAFSGLDSTDRQTLADWVAGASGIDTVMDLAVRRWNIVGAKIIFGVFESNRAQASWLVVRHGARWTVACCDDGSISDVSASLPHILSLIDQARDDRTRITWPRRVR